MREVLMFHAHAHGVSQSMTPRGLCIVVGGLLLLLAWVDVSWGKPQGYGSNDIPKYPGSPYDGPHEKTPGGYYENEYVEEAEECVNESGDPDTVDNMHSKNKVEHFGEILKGYVAALRKTSNRKVELAFLMDGSGSVGKENFANELKFVRKMLADFEVDTNTTRVAVITFSSRSRVIRHIDHMTNPSDELHKCSLLEEELPKIGYTGGGTYTQGALLEAQEVFKSARPDAKKAVFLITDGYSNHVDPRHAAQQLRKDGVEMFTFGIMNGNFEELCHMASEPRKEHTYILDTFLEFESLARRALHEDLHSGTNIPQNINKCNSLCATGFDCCDASASCSCGTYSGKYACLCHPGYYGNGLKGGCIACPEGTYKNSTGNGGENDCIRCPDINHVSPPGSTSIHECVCKKGFKSRGPYSCAAMNCPKLKPLTNGHFVNQKGCNTVYNAACGVRCDPGYSLIGSSVRLCNENGSWSGEEAYCQVKLCPRLRAPSHGRMSCTNSHPVFSTTCRFYCDDGYQLVGTETRLCLAIAHWNGLQAECREVTCKPLTKPTDGEIVPASCTTGPSSFGTTCSYHCNHGYTLEGHYSKQCTKKGSWVPREGQESKCVDSDAPLIQCPEDITVRADKNENTARVDWEIPVAVDNSGFLPTVNVIPVKIPPVDLPIGKTIMTYIAEDSGRNKNKCSFIISVKDTQPPRIDKCLSPPPFVRKNKDAKVTWEEPIFSDNSGERVTIKQSHKPGVFPLGRTVVSYTATDKHSNNNTCYLEIIVQENACANPIPPINGDLSCLERYNGLECKLSCHKGYGFAMKPAARYLCDYDNGQWKPQSKMPFPDCSASTISNHVVQKTRLKYKAKATCNEGLLLNQVESSFRKHLSNKVSEYCDPKVLCSMGMLETECRDKDTHTNDPFNLEVLTNQIGHDNMQGRNRQRREAGGELGVETTEPQETTEYLMKKIDGAQRDQPNEPSLGPGESSVGFQFEVSGKLVDAGPLINSERQAELKTAIEYIMQKLQEEAFYGQLSSMLSDEDLDFEAVAFERNDPEFACEEGSMLRELDCVRCPVGTFFDVVRMECHSCGLGTYQPTEGQPTCLVCPANTSTAMNNSRSVEQCKGQCLPGTFSYDGLEPCETCPIGHFQSDYAMSACYQCPGNTTTWRRGIRTMLECGYMCPEGYVSKTGLHPCFPCPMGYFQPEKGKSSCYLCPGRVRTTMVGSTSITDCEGVSGAQRGGDSIPTNELKMNECFEEPCMNNATCLPLTVGYTCMCVPGWKGIHCEVDIDECLPNPCHNNATCEDFLNAFECTCDLGYTGDICEQEINECESDPCVNNGTCIDKLGSYECDCHVGLIGLNCEMDIDECYKQPCRNGGTCANLIGRFECTCPDGFIGRTCAVNVDECESSPCVNNGTCVDGSNDFRCLCPLGYSGKICETEVDECASNPCSGQATCMDLIGKFSCRCPPAYSGVLCEERRESTFDLMFETSGITDFVSLERMYDNLTEVTVAFWMRTSDKDNYGCPISYATDAIENAFTITDYGGFVLYVNGETRVTDVTATDDRWHHICVTWSSDEGQWQIFKDGILKDKGLSLANGTVTEAGGVWVLGQEQDARGSSFSASESFVGTITQLHIWDSVLSLSGIHELAGPCSENVGNIRAWPDFLDGIHGRVKKVDSSYCTDCPIPEPMMNANLTLGGTSLNSTASYMCETGYEMNNNKGNAMGKRMNLTCDMFGDWQGETYICSKKSCGYPGIIDNGKMIGLLFTYGNSVSYECKDGYRLIGNGTRFCGAEGVWDPQKQPSCEEILCPSPQRIPAMRITMTKSKYRPGDRLIFNCLPGHRQYGERNLQCDMNGEWNHGFPSCDRILCFDPPTIENGRALARKNQSFALQQSVKYECNIGYRRDGPTSVRCVGDGSWDQKHPTCTFIECPKPSTIYKGKMSGDNFTLNGEVKFVCNVGYVLVGEETLRCTLYGNWSASVPVCNIVTCPSLRVPEHASLRAGSLDYNTVVMYSCNVGFAMKGEANRKCLESGEWNSSDPVCEPVQCGDPEDIEHGDIEGTGRFYQDEIVYKCDEGYKLAGASRRYCSGQGTWTPRVPTCKAIECYTPGRPNRGRVIGDSYTYQSVIEFTCDAGYVLVGNKKRRCQADGRWEGQVPKCNEIKCTAPPPIEHARYAKKWKYLPGDVIKFKCDKGYKLFGKDTRTCKVDGTWSGPVPECQMMSCGAPNSVLNGKLLGDETRFGSKIEYVCDEGYQLDGPPERTCEGTWTGSEPRCNAKLCEEAPPVEHGHYDGDARQVGSVISLTCDEGYEMKGTAEITCRQNQTWTDPDATCEKVQCDKPSTVISNGRMIDNDFSFNDTINYVCDSGYYIDGPTFRICQADKTWKNPIPVCDRKECERPLKPSKGKVEGFDFRYKEKVKYFCNKGYRVSGPVMRECQSDGTWSGDEPVCLRIECPSPSDVEHGEVFTQGLFYGNTIQYKCNNGFTVEEGDEKRECQANSTWSGTVPKCVASICGKAPSIEGGEPMEEETVVGKAPKYMCKLGLMLMDSPGFTCSKAGNYTGPLPRCAEVECPVPAEIERGINILEGRKYGDVVSYACRPGYEVIGDGLQRCEGDGEWTGSQPTCEIIRCFPPRPIDNGEVETPDGISLGKVATYACDKGYDLIEDAERTCLADKSWSGGEPRCEKPACPRPEVDHGYITVSTGGRNIEKHVHDLDRFVAGMIIDLDCERGFNLVGSSEIECFENKTWSFEIPTCERIRCEDPGIDNAVITAPLGMAFERRILVSCEPGYEMEGKPEIFCLASGFWSQGLPTCKLITCPQPFVDHGTIKVITVPNIGVGYPYGIKIGLSCFSGYVLSGRVTTTCGADGLWTHELPICVKVVCQPPLIKNKKLTIVNAKEEYAFQESITFVCDEDFDVAGNKELGCGEGRKWNDTLPTCRMKQCPRPVIENGYFKTDVTALVSHFGIGLDLKFNCKSGYELAGEAMLTCLKGQTWSQDIPVCVKVTCPRLTLEHGKVIKRGDITGNEVGARLAFHCNRGYELQGEKSNTCLKSGTWSFRSPTCERVSCTPPNVDHSIVDAIEQQIPGKYLYDDVVKISCEDGYYQVGKSEFTCQANGQWRGLLPICEPKECLAPEFEHGVLTIMNRTGQASARKRYTYSMVVMFSCSTGYILMGDTHGSCQADGNWSISTPACQPLACPELNITNALANSSAGDIYNVFGLTAEIHCEMGYELFGDPTIKCTSLGQWEGTIPKCVPTECPDPVIPNAELLELTQIEGMYMFGDIVQYMCHNGYELSGEGEIICLHNKHWLPGLPSCNRVRCNTPSLDWLDGDITVEGPDGENNFTFGTKLKFECFLGSSLEGLSEIECGADKEWSGVYPQCNAINCPDPFIEEGEVHGAPTGDGDKYIFGDSVRFECNPGFVLSGDKEMVCDPYGRWFAPYPVCERIHCPAPPQIEHGRLNGDSFRFEDLVLYVCDEGYELEGTNRIFCQADMSWSGSAECVKVSCGMPPSLVNGEFMSSGGFSFGDTIMYTCNDGYELLGEESHLCVANGTWSGVISVCGRVECGPLPAISHGKFPVREWYYGDKVSINCDVGYELDGIETIQCQANRQWGQVEGRCKIITCNPPGFPDHGTIEGAIFNFESVITYTCDQGYQVVGEPRRICKENGKWSGDGARCERIRCTKPDVPESGFIEAGDNKFESQITYKCNRGFELEGRSVRDCLADGSWSGEAPKCLVIICSLPPEIEHGDIIAESTTYESTIEYVCDFGYTIHGIAFRLCTSAREWSGTEPTCEKVTCDAPPSVKDGYFEGDDFTFGGIVKYFCHAKYDMLGDAERVCKGDRSWSGNKVQCRIKTCPPPRSNPHTLMQGDDYTVGRSVQFSCDEGYQLAGAKELTCKDGDEWSGEFPFCDKVSCGLPKSLENAVIYGESYEFQDTVEYRCITGYKVDGKIDIECTAGGTWTDLEAKCIKVSCGPPPVIEHTTLKGDSFEFEDFVAYKCDVGYEMNGHNLLQCGANEQWSGSLPTCSMVTCGKPPVIPHASIIVHKTTYGSKSTYQCNDGYVLRGSAAVRCVENGTWIYDQRPRCEPVKCGTPPNLENGGVKVPDVTFGNIARYYCLPGHILQGLDTMQCGPDGLWNGVVPLCIPVRCPAPLPPKNGAVATMSDDSFAFSNEIVFSCHVGFELVGVAVSKCQEDGSWSGSRPRCDLVYCGPPDAPENGNVSATGHHYDSHLQYSCADGYQLVGNLTGICQDDGFWSVPTPICSPVPTTTESGYPCQPPIFPDNVVEVEGQFVMGESILLACREGYSSTEQLSMTCQDDLTWSQPLATCERISCGPPKPDPMVMIMGHSFKYGDRLSYMCNRGLIPATETILTCQANGHWDYAPRCRATCKFECQNGGMCIGLNKCKCQPGYGGRFCQLAICILPCQNGGRCTAPYQCTCSKGYAGDRCETPVCFPPCQNGGMCVRPDRCSCPHGYDRPFCSRPAKKRISPFGIGRGR